MKSQIFNFKIQDVLQNILCKTTYPKGISRGFIINKKNTLLLDNSDTFSPLLLKNKTSLPHQHLLGLNLKKVLFKSAGVKNLFFTLYTPNFSQLFSRQKMFNSFRKSLICLSKSSGFLLILHPLKGGFSGLLNGFLGYIKTSSMSLFFSTFLKYSVIKNELAFSDSFLYYTFLPRIPVLGISAVFFPGITRPIFRKRKIKILKRNFLRILFKF